MAASSAGSTPSASADATQDRTTHDGTPRDDTGGRKRSGAKFGLASIVLLTINGIIGSGIFLPPAPS